VPPKKNRLTQVSLLQQDFCDPILMLAFYSRFLPDFFAAAQRFRIASAIRLRPAADIPRLFFGPRAAGLFTLPGGRPRRLPPPDIPPSEL
jgi:hypothetical protein